MNINNFDNENNIENGSPNYNNNNNNNLINNNNNNLINNNNNNIINNNNNKLIKNNNNNIIIEEISEDSSRNIKHSNSSLINENSKFSSSITNSNNKNTNTMENTEIINEDSSISSSDSLSSSSSISSKDSENNNKSKKNDDFISEEEKNEIKEAFNIIDKDCDGFIKTDELATLLRTLGHNPTKEELDELIKQYDIDNSGTIDFNEFIVLMNNKLKEQQEGQELLETFQVFDKDADGFINADDIKAVRDWVKEGTENLDDDLIRELIEQGDRDGDGKINYHEFVRIMTMK